LSREIVLTSRKGIGPEDFFQIADDVAGAGCIAALMKKKNR
jgi:hypothetical protein